MFFAINICTCSLSILLYCNTITVIIWISTHYIYTYTLIYFNIFFYYKFIHSFFYQSTSTHLVIRVLFYMAYCSLFRNEERLKVSKFIVLFFVLLESNCSRCLLHENLTVQKDTMETYSAGMRSSLYGRIFFKPKNRQICQNLFKAFIVQSVYRVVNVPGRNFFVVSGIHRTGGQILMNDSVCLGPIACNTVYCLIIPEAVDLHFIS